MFKRCIWLAAMAVLVVSQFFSSPAVAAERYEATRTIELNNQGDTLGLSLGQVARGRKQFNYACGSCHTAGVTKTNPTVGLDPESLAGVLPQQEPGSIKSGALSHRELVSIKCRDAAATRIGQKKSGALPQREKGRIKTRGAAATKRSEERRGGKEGRTRWSPDH